MSTSKLQRETGKRLRKLFGKYGIVENVRPNWLVSSKGERLELDFFIDKLSVAIEVQGKQHFEFTPIFHTTEFDFLEQVRRDREKKAICDKASIDLLYVERKTDIECILYHVQSTIDDQLKCSEWQETNSSRLKNIIHGVACEVTEHENRYDRIISKRLLASDDKQEYFNGLIFRVEQAVIATNGFEPSALSKRKMRRNVKFCEYFIKDGKVQVSEMQQEILSIARSKSELKQS